MTRISDIFYGQDTNNVLLRKSWDPALTGAYPSDTTEGILYISESDGTVGGVDYKENATIIYKDNGWVAIGSGGSGSGSSEVIVSDTPPSSPSAGTLWWNSSIIDGGIMYIWYAASGTPAWVPTTVNGVDGQDGQGVPVGGTAGQALTKIDGTDHNTAWTDTISDAIVDFTPNAGGGTISVPRRPLVMGGDPNWHAEWVGITDTFGDTTTDRSSLFEYTTSGMNIINPVPVGYQPWRYPVDTTQVTDGAKLYFSYDMSNVDLTALPIGAEVSRDVSFSTFSAQDRDFLRIFIARSNGNASGAYGDASYYPYGWYCAKIYTLVDGGGNGTFYSYPYDRTNLSGHTLLGDNEYIGAATPEALMALIGKITVSMEFTNTDPSTYEIDLGIYTNGAQQTLYTYYGNTLQSPQKLNETYAYDYNANGTYINSRMEEDTAGLVLFSDDAGAESDGFTSFAKPTTSNPTLLSGTDTLTGGATATLSDLTSGVFNRFTADVSLDGTAYKLGEAVGVSSDGLSVVDFNSGSGGGLSASADETITGNWTFENETVIGHTTHGGMYALDVNNPSFGEIQAIASVDTTDTVKNGTTVLYSGPLDIQGALTSTTGTGLFHIMDSMGSNSNYVFQVGYQVEEPSALKRYVSNYQTSTYANGSEETIYSFEFGNGNAYTFTYTSDNQLPSPTETVVGNFSKDINFNASLRLPVSNSGSAPTQGTGCIRYNSTSDAIEVYDAGWNAVGGGSGYGLNSIDTINKTTSFAADSNKWYTSVSDVSGGKSAVTITAPTSPSEGDEVWIQSTSLSFAPNITDFDSLTMSGGEFAKLIYLSGAWVKSKGIFDNTQDSDITGEWNFNFPSNQKMQLGKHDTIQGAQLTIDHRIGNSAKNEINMVASGSSNGSSAYMNLSGTDTAGSAKGYLSTSTSGITGFIVEPDTISIKASTFATDIKTDRAFSYEFIDISAGLTALIGRCYRATGATTMQVELPDDGVTGDQVWIASACSDASPVTIVGENGISVANATIADGVLYKFMLIVDSGGNRSWVI